MLVVQVLVLALGGEVRCHRKLVVAEQWTGGCKILVEWEAEILWERWLL